MGTWKSLRVQGFMIDTESIGVLYGSVLVSWCAKNRHILTAPEH